MKNNLIATAVLLLASSAFAETLHIGRFASMSSKEDNSPLKIQSVKVTTFASTSGSTLALKGCNEGKIVTGQTGPFKTSYKSIESSKIIKSEIINDSRIELDQALVSLQANQASLKAKIPFYCNVKSVVAVEMKVEVLNTKRLAKAILTLTPSSLGDGRNSSGKSVSKF